MSTPQQQRTCNSGMACAYRAASRSLLTSALREDGNSGKGSSFMSSNSSGAKAPKTVATDISSRRLISTTKAAARLNVSSGTIRTYIADGKLRGYKVGRLIKCDVKEVDALVVTIDNS
jgi:excisionase family DNA binding protein